MLTSLSVRNFKSFNEEGRIAVRPITVVMGGNSSGKSSLLRALFLLRQTAEVRDRLTAGVFEGQFAQFGSFHDFAYKHSLSTNVGVSWGFRDGFRPRFAIPDPREGPRGAIPPQRFLPRQAIREVTLDAEFTYNRRSTEVRSEQVALESVIRLGDFEIRGLTGSSRPDLRMHIERRRLDNTWSELSYHFPELDMGGSYKVRRTGKFYDLSIGQYHARQRISGPYIQPILRRVVGELAAYIEFEAQRLILLGPLRTEARRFYLLTGERPEQTGLAGEKSIEMLWISQRVGRGVIDFVQRWLKAFDISLNIQLRRLPRTSFLAVELVDPATNVLVQLADVGVGASQVLPILIEGATAPRDTTLVIEQPELHLHPAAQAEMADALIEMAKRRGKVLIVETHSEHLVRRLQRRVADSTLEPNDVAVYYIDRLPQGSTITPIPIGQDGTFLSEALPEGFFDVDYREAEAITAAWRDRRASAGAGGGAS